MEEQREDSLFRRLINNWKAKEAEKKLNRNPIYISKPRPDSLKIVKGKKESFSSLQKRFDDDSLIMLIFGKRGSGKSALGFRLLENLHGNTKRPCFVMGISNQIIPKWIKPIENIQQAPNEAIILVDEGGVSFNSRESMKKKNQELGKLLAIARHKNLSVIFITQNTGLIDKNVLQMTDTLFIKEGSLLQLEMERNEMKKFYEKAKDAFSKIKEEKNKFAYVLDSDFEGVIQHSLPSFWSEELSKSRANTPS